MAESEEQVTDIPRHEIIAAYDEYFDSEETRPRMSLRFFWYCREMGFDKDVEDPEMSYEEWKEMKGFVER